MTCFATVQNLTVETWVLKLSSLKLLIETGQKLRLQGIETVETWVKNLLTVNNFSTVEPWALKQLRLRPSIKTISEN